MMAIDFGHLVETAVTSTAPILLYMWRNRQRAKKDVEQKHEQNVRMFLDFKKQADEDRKYYTPHEHLEKGDAPLLASGIRKAMNGTR